VCGGVDIGRRQGGREAVREEGVTPEICETFDEDDADDATRIGLKSVR